MGLDAIERARELVDQVKLDGRLARYIVELVQATRSPRCAGLEDIAPYLQYGASPRATIWLALAARAQAFMEQRGFVVPGDIKAVAPAVLRHRLLTTYEAEAEGVQTDELTARLLETVPVP